MLGGKKQGGIFSTLGKLLELEKVGSEALFFEDCTETNIVKALKNSDLFLMYPQQLQGRNGVDGTGLFEAVSAGYILAKKGHVVILSTEPENLNPIFDGEPVVRSIGEAIGYFRRERKVFESNKILLQARRKISDAGLSFSSRGLVEAVETSMYDETQAFFRAGFSTETETADGVPLMSLAVRKGDLEMCRMLMSYGASLNLIARDRRSSPVLDAVSAGKQEAAELLINSGADLNFRNRNGQTALVVAIGARMEGIADLLIDRGADITIRDSLGMTAVEYARLFSLTGLIEKLEAKL